MLKIFAFLVVALPLTATVSQNVYAQGREASHLGAERPGGEQGGPRLRREFGRNFYGFGPWAGYGTGGPPLFYGDSLRCYLHQRVLTPNGWTLVPIYVC